MFSSKKLLWNLFVTSKLYQIWRDLVESYSQHILKFSNSNYEFLFFSSQISKKSEKSRTYKKKPEIYLWFVMTLKNETIWWRCRKYVANSGKTLFFCAKRAQMNETSNQDRSQSFLATPDINWAIGKDREWFLQVLFAPAPHKCKTPCPKVGSPPYSALTLTSTVYFPIEITNSSK